MTTEKHTPDDQPSPDGPVETSQQDSAVDEPLVADSSGEASVPDPAVEASVPDPADEAAVPDPVAEASVPDPVAEASVPDPVAESLVVEDPDAQGVDPAGTAAYHPVVDTVALEQADTEERPGATTSEAVTAATEPVVDDTPARNAPDPFDLFTAGSTPPAWTQPAPTMVAATTDPEPQPRRLRVGTVVWGLILAACGLGVIAWASGARIDYQLALIILLAAAGTALLVGSIVSGARRARH
ncbi:hypothetical protein [Cellulomonas sp. URHD0024]|uniref:hypothetical protein n=1 Tax=Cellulomonas sp. URHD0024 TaxID=1302620 RepID=UPI0003FA306E|nr:hypothetical protein [Cellulomonas sp. URHD0024]